MNRKIVESLKKIANNLDNNGYYKEANSITKVMIRVADEFNMTDDENMPMVNPNTFQKPMQNLETETLPAEDPKEKRRQEILKEVLDKPILATSLNDKILNSLYENAIKDSETTYRFVINNFFLKLGRWAERQITAHYMNTNKPHQINDIIKKSIDNFISYIEENEKYKSRLPLPPIKYYINQKYQMLNQDISQMEEKYSAYHDF